LWEDDSLSSRLDINVFVSVIVTEYNGLLDVIHVNSVLQVHPLRKEVGGA
jgi:hypothetical protein